MLQIGNLKFEKLSSEKHKNKVFKLIWILDINHDLKGSYDTTFNCLFQEENRGYYLIEKIQPELLMYYTIGSYFKNSRKLDQRDCDGQIYHIKIQSNPDNQPVNISSVISDNEYDFNHGFEVSDRRIDYSITIKKQFCQIFDDILNNQKVIIPSAVIGARYFFTSTVMRKRIFDSKLSRLHRGIGKDEKENVPVIKLKPGTAQSDAPYIVFYSINDYAKKAWHSVANLIRQKIYSSYSPPTKFPFICRFPILGEHNMIVRGVKIPSVQRDKLLVYEIVDEDNFFGFDEIVIKTDKKQVENKPLKFQLKASDKVTNKLTDRRPSSRSSIAGIRADYEKEIVISRGIKFVFVKEASDEKINSMPIYVPGEDEEDLSFGDPNGEQKGVKPARLSRDTEVKKDKKKRQKDLFTFDDFLKMVSYLNEYPEVTGFRTGEEKFVPRRQGRKRWNKCNQKESYDGNCKNRRKYLHIDFRFKDLNVSIIELDQRGLTNGSYIFILASKNEITDSHRNFILRLYVQSEKMDKITFTARRQGIKLVCKKHPVEKSEKYYRLWCEGVIKKLYFTKDNQ
ncbi:hypothetical protein [Desulfovulcanus sp.]